MSSEVYLCINLVFIINGIGKGVSETITNLLIPLCENMRNAFFIHFYCHIYGIFKNYLTFRSQILYNV